MSILDRLGSVTGDKESNSQLAKECLANPALLHTFAEGVRTGKRPVQLDCGAIFVEVSNRMPQLLEPFFAALWMLATDSNKRMKSLGLKALLKTVFVHNSALFGERDDLLKMAKELSPQGHFAFQLLCAMATESVNYRGKLYGKLLHFLDKVEDEKLFLKRLKLLDTVAGNGREPILRLIDSAITQCEGYSEETKKKVHTLTTKLKKRI